MTKYKAPVANKYPKIVYLSALFAGRAIRSGRLIATTLMVRDMVRDGEKDMDLVRDVDGAWGQWRGG